MTVLEIKSRYWIYDVFLLPYCQVKDQKLRALCLALMLVPGHHDTVRLRDDGCGFLFVFLECVLHEHGEAFLNSLQIELVNKDPHVTAWQRAMYRCPQVTCLTAPLIQQAIGLRETTLLYLDYRHIDATSFEAVRAYLDDHKVECMISFTSADDGLMYEASVTALAETDWNAKPDKYVQKLLSPDNEIATYIISPYWGREQIVEDAREELDSLLSGK
jgi:hypothetical protein